MIQALPVETQDIVVTASRAPQAEDDALASASLLPSDRVERLGEPSVSSLLRLVPSVAVSTSGPAGSLTDVRIRGAEANHTLLFIDGIRANDPAAGNVPRFELLNADLFSRIEVVRGPQSALWGSEAIGGVVSVNSDVVDEVPWKGLGELGWFRFRRAAAQGSGTTGDVQLSGSVGWQRARGIDSFDGEGDRDGYRNLSARGRAAWSPNSKLEVGVNGFALAGRSEFDGYNAATFVRDDTLDSSQNRLKAARVWGRFGETNAAWSGQVSASALRSSNRNLLAADEINQSWGRRRHLTGQIEHRFRSGAFAHTLIGAIEHEGETFRARDVIYGGFSNQDQDRSHHSVTGEWRGVGNRFRASLAVRHDAFSRFKDATTVRGALLGEVGGGVSLIGSYAEGIAQPTFFDLYGFFPGSFVGNPDLRPERSRGFEFGLRFRTEGLRASLTHYRQRLKDEIVDTPDFTSTLNDEGNSRRRGLEAEFGYDFGAWLQLSAHYAHLQATEQSGSVSEVRELRRPKHSGAFAADGTYGRISYGASLAYSGDHFDRRDSFPYDRVRLSAYWRAGARVGFAVSRQAELFARVSNALDSKQQDVFGYRTEGRSIYAGIRLAPRR